MTAKAVHGDRLFLDAAARRAYLALLTVVARDRGWRVLHFCLTGNHVHLLLWAEVEALSFGVRDPSHHLGRPCQSDERRTVAAWTRTSRSPCASPARAGSSPSAT